MVSVSLLHHWGSVSRAFCLSALHCHYFRYVCTILLSAGRSSSCLNHRPAFRPGLPLVHLDGTTELLIAQVRVWHWYIPYSYMWRMDICHLYRRPWLARHLHDLLPRCDRAMDIRLSCPEPQQPEGSQVSQDICWDVFWHAGASDILLHPT